MTTEPMHRRPRGNGDEVDAFSPNHRIHGYRPGQRAVIKRRHNKRVRQNVSTALRAGQEVS